MSINMYTLSTVRLGKKLICKVLVALSKRNVALQRSNGKRVFTIKPTHPQLVWLGIPLSAPGAPAKGYSGVRGTHEMTPV
jgi:hypothetical protein